MPSLLRTTSCASRTASNFNPAVDFTGATGKSLKGNGTADWDATQVSIFAVSVVEGSMASTNAAIFDGLANWTVGPNEAGIGLLVNAATNAYAVDSNGVMSADTTSSTAQPRVVRALYGTVGNSLNATTWLDGVQEGTGSNRPTAATGLFEVGGRTAGASTWDPRIFNGKIAEVVVFRSAVTAANANNVESYLALKYGITLRQTPAKNYTDSTSAIIWNATTNAIYNQNIAGIGRDDDSALNQKQSRSVNTASSGNLLTIGLGAIAADNASNANAFGTDQEFLIWGDNGANPFTSITLPGGGGLWRMARIWRAQETGTVGTVQVRVPESALPGTGQVLIRSVDATFDSGDTQVLLLPNGTNYEATTDFADGEFFTFAAIPPAGPGGVVGPSLWLRPDRGTSSTVNNTALTAWNDQSAQANHATQVTAANRPLYEDNATDNLNFNPAIKLDGSNDFMNLTVAKLPAAIRRARSRSWATSPTSLVTT